MAYIPIAKARGFTPHLLTLRQASINPLLLPRKIAYIEDLVVHKDYRNRGVGTLLFESVKNEVCKLGYNKLELMVWNFNESAAYFYEKLGMNKRSIIMEMNT